MTPEFKTRLRERIDRLVQYMDGEAPDPIIGKQIAHIFWTSMAQLSKPMTDDLGLWIAEAARQGACLCQYCDNHVPTRASFPPICHECQAKDTVETLEEEMGENDNGLSS